MVEVRKAYKITLIHPRAKGNIEITFYDEDQYIAWKPYMVKIEEWLIHQYMVNVTNNEFKDQ